MSRAGRQSALAARFTAATDSLARGSIPRHVWRFMARFAKLPLNQSDSAEIVRAGDSMTNTIHHAAIHDLQRAEAGFKVVLGNDHLPIKGPIQRVLDDLHNLYNRRPSKAYGRFSDSPNAGPTRVHLEEYLSATKPDFASLTEKMMETLRVRASARAAAGAGHVFFVHFSGEREGSYLMVAILTDKLGAALTKTYDVQDVVHLDMDGFRFAGRIDLDAWAKNDPRYIGFLKGKGEVSEYFKEFLGCDTTLQNRQDTNTLVETIKRFADAEEMKPEARDAFLETAKRICERSAVAKEPIDFTTLSNELFPTEPEKLMAALGDPALKLSDGFVPHRGALNRLVKFKAVTPLWSLEFDREALRSNQVRFDPDEKTLTLTGLPDHLLSELRDDRGLDDPT